MLSDAFYKALAMRESSGDPSIVNKYGFMGLYQMGQPALQDVKYMDGQGNWLGKNGIKSREDFLASPDIQTQAVREYHELVWNRYLPQSVRDSVGTSVKGVEVTKSGLVAAAHLVGHGGLKSFMASKGESDRTDAMGTRCSEYFKLFGGY